MNGPELPDPLRDLILTLAARPDVHSVSCQFWDARLWEGLLREQVERARQTGKPPGEAFFLCGPDSGIPGIAKHHALLAASARSPAVGGCTAARRRTRTAIRSVKTVDNDAR